MTKEELLQAIKELSVLDLSELVKDLEKEFGVSAAPAAVAFAPTAAGPAVATAPTEEEEEQTEFTVLIQDAGTNKINVIKAVREVTTLGLREAKELVEAAPKPVREAVSKEEAQDVRQKLEAAGARVAVE